MHEEEEEEAKEEEEEEEEEEEVTSPGFPLALRWFEVDGGHGANQLHWAGLHQGAAFLLPPCTLQEQTSDPHSILEMTEQRYTQKTLL